MYICIHACTYLMIVLHFISPICTSFMHYTLIRANSFYRFFYIKCTFVANGCVICIVTITSIIYPLNDKQIVQLYGMMYRFIFIQHVPVLHG